jgi:hypothetical protein
MPKYPALRVISFIIRLVGWLLLIIGIIGIAVVVLIVNNGANLDQNLAEAIRIGVLTISSVSSFLSGIFIIALGELIKVAVDIARNTARCIPEGR